MDQTMYQTMEKTMFSRIPLTKKLQRVIVGLALLVSISGTAIAQYPGGGGGGGGTGTGSYPSYGSKGAVIGGVVAGAAAGAGLLYWKLHSRTKLQGCVAGAGDKLVSERDNHTYTLASKQSETLKPGERVELLGKEVKDASGEPTFEVHRMSRDLGQCTAITAEQR